MKLNNTGVALWDPANPTWDPSRDFGTSHMGSRQTHLGFHLKSQAGFHQSHLGSWLCPRWDSANPTRDFGSSHMRSQLKFKAGSRQSHVQSRVGYHPGIWKIPYSIPPNIPGGIPGGILQGFCVPYPRWESTNPTWDPLQIPT